MKRLVRGGRACNVQLEALKAHDVLLQGPAHQQAVHVHGAALAQAVGAVHGLPPSPAAQHQTLVCMFLCTIPEACGAAPIQVEISNPWRLVQLGSACGAAECDLTVQLESA